MATKVKDTPVLRGKVARRFEVIIKENEIKKASQEERSRILEVYRSVKIVDKRDELNTLHA